jgi:hypothetical protein
MTRLLLVAADPSTLGIGGSLHGQLEDHLRPVCTREQLARPLEDQAPVRSWTGRPPASSRVSRKAM